MNRSDGPNEHERQRLRETLAAVPEIRANVVNALRKAVKTGTYRVRNEDIADSICRELRSANYRL